MDEKTKTQNALIKTVFQGNENLLKVMRALFFGLGVSEEEKNLVRTTFGNPDLREAIRYRFFPSINRDTPIGQVQDVWMNADQGVYSQARDTIEQTVQNYEMSHKMVLQALALLENPNGEAPRVEYSASVYLNDPLQINLLARNRYIRHIESQLLMLKAVSEAEEKTPLEMAKIAHKNSAE